MADLKVKNGFTLIEMMIALAVLMIGLVGIIGIQVAGVHQLTKAKQRTAATQLGTQIMESLKNAPINRDDSSQIFVDSSGKSLADADGAALLEDAVSGDGFLTWHRLRPMKADGTILPAADSWNPEYFYMAIYGVEWGGAGGSQFIDAGGTNDELVLAKYPDTVPGANEIYIEVWIFWVEPGQRVLSAGGQELKSIWDYYEKIGTGFPNAPSVVPRRRMVLKTIRRV